MKRYFLLITILFAFATANAQHHDLAIADIDLDGTADTIRIDRNEGVIICSLSRQKFKPQKSLPMASLTEEGNRQVIGLSSEPGTFQLYFMGERSNTRFIFVYNKRKKSIYLNEYWSDELGDIMGNGTNEITHNLQRRRINYWVRYSNAPKDADNYNETSYTTKRVNKRVKRMRMPLKKFSDTVYYQKTQYIREELYSRQ